MYSFIHSFVHLFIHSLIQSMSPSIPSSQTLPLGQFPLRFLGTSDYRLFEGGRVYLYVEGDSEVSSPDPASESSSEDLLYSFALAEAAGAHDALHRVRETQKQKFKESLNRKPPAYQFVRTNQPFGEVEKRFSTPIDPSDIPACECRADKPCEDDECLNRLLLYECHPSTCPTGKRCRNQRFQKRLYPKLSVFKTANDRGWGLKVGT